MLSLARQVILTDVESGAVLLDERTGRYWVMNDTGALVLRCLLDGGTIDTAAARLCAGCHDVDRDRARVDSEALVERLRSASLVTS